MSVFPSTYKQKAPIITRVVTILKNPVGQYGDFKRLRAGDYRIIFEDLENVILIYEIKHRQEAYHD
jgi:mRNA-degrading endonuclease RelE of RelBE toxin-antitoxin system